MWWLSAALAAPIVAGLDHTCVLHAGAVWCWGDGAPTPERVPGTEGATDLRSGVDHVCAALPGGATSCFRAGAGAPGSVPSPVPPDALGDELTCGVEGGAVACVGDLRLVQPPPPPAGGGMGRGVGAIGGLGTREPPAPRRPALPGGARLAPDVPAAGLTAGDGLVCGLAGGVATCQGWDDAARRVGRWELPERGVARVIAEGRAIYTVDGAGVVRVGAGSGPRARLAGPEGFLAGVRAFEARGRAWCAEDARGWWCGGPLAGDALAVRVDGFRGARAVAVGARHACALVGDDVRCLGAGEALGTGPARAEAAPVPGLVATSIAAGTAFTCASREGGPPVCWGGGPAVVGGPAAAPRAVPGVGRADAVVAGEEHACAALGGEVRCWGSDAFGQLGDGAGRPPGRRGLPGPASALAVGAYGGACALVGDTAWCWSGEGPAEPVEDGVVAVAVDQGGPCVVRRDGTVACGGAEGPLVPVPGVSGALSVTRGLMEDCAVTRAGGVVCWSDRQPAAPVAGVSGAVAVDAVGGQSCAVQRDGAVVCWGDNSDGVLGASPDALERSDRAVPIGLRGVQVATTAGATCVRAPDGSAACLGSGLGGLFGDGVLVDRDALWADEGPRPVRRGGPKTPPLVDLALSGGTWPHGCGADEDGAVWCWGDDGDGVLRDVPGWGLPGWDGLPAATPVRVTGLPADVVDVEVGGALACARTRGGEVWCWGDGARGVPPRTAAAAVRGLPGAATRLRAGGHTTCARVGADTWCWGWNPVHDDRGDDPGDPLTSGIPGRIPAATPTPRLALSTWGLCTADDAEVACFGMDILGSLGPDPEPLPAELRWTFPAPPPPPPPPPAPAPAPGDLSDRLEAGGILGSLFGDSVSDTFGGLGLLGSGLGEGVEGEGYGGLLGDGWGGGLGSASGREPAPQPPRPGPQQGRHPFGARALAQGGLGTCAVRADGTLVCWGGAGREGDREVARDVAQVAVGEELACFLTRAGAASCWGRGGLVTPVAGVAGAVELAVGKDHACARTAAGAVSCWGSDAEGQLGRGPGPTGSEPVSVRLP